MVCFGSLLLLFSIRVCLLKQLFFLRHVLYTKSRDVFTPDEVQLVFILLVSVSTSIDVFTFNGDRTELYIYIYYQKGSKCIAY